MPHYFVVDCNELRKIEENEEMKKIIALILVVVVAVGAGGFYFLNQPRGQEKDVIGTWYSNNHDQTLVFKKDKTLEITNKSGETRAGNWRIISNKVKMKFSPSYNAEFQLPDEDIKAELTSIRIKMDLGAMTDRFYSGVFEKQ